MGEYVGTEGTAVASEVASAKPTPTGHAQSVNFVNLFDSVNPFTAANRPTAAGKFYGTWCSLYSTLNTSKLIDPALLQATHTAISSAIDVLSRLQGSAKVPYSLYPRT